MTRVTLRLRAFSFAFLNAWQDPADQGCVRQDVFVTDASARTTTSLDVALVGTDIDHQVQQPAISGDGTKVAFTTSASLAARDTNTHLDVYVHVLATRVNTLASRTRMGSPPGRSIATTG